MRYATVILACLAGLSAASCAERPERNEDVIVFKHGKTPGDHRLLRDLLDRFEAESGIRVIDEILPSFSDVQHQYFITTLEGGGSDLDVISMDVIWVPEFSRAGWLLDLSERLPAAERGDFFAAPIDASTYRGRLYGVPWYIDAGVLYYRKDLLEKYGLGVPESYPELADAARTVLDGENDPDLYGFLWQGKQYEGLVCVTLEVLSSFGGDVLENGEVGIASPKSKAAFRFLRELLTSGVSPPLVATSDEESTRTMFGAGKAVFLRNWVYVWNLVERPGSPVRGKVGLAPIPPGPLATGSSTLGGWQLGISRQSRHPEGSLGAHRVPHASREPGVHVPHRRLSSIPPVALPRSGACRGESDPAATPADRGKGAPSSGHTSLPRSFTSSSVGNLGHRGGCQRSRRRARRRPARDRVLA